METISDPVLENKFAAQGKLVIAANHSPDETKPGHIAVVIYSNRTEARIKEDGPDINGT
ncbi:hypothetical protein [Rubripirellula reticaptiva]|uniref:hypothetical protein n=1 Tax=Rubripirellula reticaptiva TaxID=2528013 RepID=UPI00164576D9|nr:hypothetical protein [Rubripirellula reticaptiva]